MARKFKELQDALYAKMTPSELAAHKLSLAKDLERVRLSQMRTMQGLSQAALAERLGTDQGSISRLEKQGDMYMSTLSSYVEGLGGRLEMLLVFPEQTVILEVGE